MLIKVAEFSKTPYGRTEEDGAYNGKRFRLQYLKPAYQSSDEKISVDFNGTVPPGSSFLDEAFAGLIRYEGMKLDEVWNRLEIISDFPLYEIQIKDFLDKEVGVKNDSI